MRSRGKLFALVTSIVMSAALVGSALGTPVNAAPKPQSHKWRTGGVKPAGFGMLDCNGLSPIQRPAKVSSVCSDPKGYEGGRFYDNGRYIGHDEPIVRFTSNHPGSGNHTLWREKLPLDPHRRPTVHRPGSDITHWFELSIAPWFSMALCNSRSFPLTQHCTPNSDSNAPSATSPGGGSSFLEMQFYPPGFGPFPDNISCDNTHWCASLHINDLECDVEFNCNPNCIEPTNFAFVQTDGVPTGPPSPQLANLASFTPNSHTLLMNPGDRIVAKIFDADIGGGKHALETRIDDLTTGKSGYMIASAQNGFMATNAGDCSGVPFNYEPEYKTAAQDNVIPWAALETNISTQYEIGHFIPCSKVEDPAVIDLGGVIDTTWQTCKGPYEQAGEHSSLPEEFTDAFCFPEGFRHHGLAPPNLVTGCTNIFSGGDTNFDGTSYWPDWPNHKEAHRYPQPFLQRQPLTAHGPYQRFQFQTDAPASEASCDFSTGEGCAVPPPGAPGDFYPYWTLAKVDGKCVWEFGQMTNGKTFGKAEQYGTPSPRFFGTVEGPIRPLPNC